MKNRIAFGLTALLMLATMLAWYQPSWADESVILGEPAQGMAVSATPTPSPTPATNGERPSGSIFAYLPLVIDQSLIPEAQAVVDLINDERIKGGCAPLQVNHKLMTAAQLHSEDMALNDFFDHTGSDGSSFVDRIEAQGYIWSTGGENIAAGYGTAAEAVDGWMNSQGHRNNILNCNFQETGVGYFYLLNDTGSVNYGRYWTQVFASP